MDTAAVVIIGAGPTGLAAATLLGQYGVDCLVLERWDSIYPQPRAVALDDEVHRILARLGVRDAFAAISWPHQGLRLVDRSMRVLAEFRRERSPGRNGYPQGSMFDQPELEAILHGNLERYGTVRLRYRSEVAALAQDVSGVWLDVVDRRSGNHGAIRAQYVLGCDGARSLTREWIGASLSDSTFSQRWFVVDVETEAELGHWNGAHHVCDPVRPSTFMRVGRTRYRWEFQLAPGETAGAFREMARLHPMISPWTGDVPPEKLKVVRAAVYTFRAQTADSWRDRRVFLLGDAAHLTPPFIGQGMGAGLRDAMNLGWKLACVLRGTLPETVLDTYEIERKRHARAMIRAAKVVGHSMKIGGALGKVFRRVVAPRLHLVPGLRRLAQDSETPALQRSALVHRPLMRRTLAGRLCPNVRLDRGRRLDEVAGGRFALVTSVEPSSPQRAAVERRGALLLAVRPGSELHRWLRRGHARAALVRPDGTVLRAGRRLSVLCRALPYLDTSPSPTPTARVARLEEESAAVSARARGWQPGA